MIGLLVVLPNQLSFFHVAQLSLSLRHLIPVFPISLFYFLHLFVFLSAIFVCISWRSWTGNGHPYREKWLQLHFRYGNVLPYSFLDCPELFPSLVDKMRFTQPTLSPSFHLSVLYNSPARLWPSTHNYAIPILRNACYTCFGRHAENWNILSWY